MKKTLFILIVILVIAVAVFGFYYLRGDERNYGEENYVPQPEEQEIFLVKDDFSLLLPQGWRESAGFQGVAAMAINAEEEITDSDAKKINFRTYYSVTYDVLQGRTLEDYAEYVKESLRQLLVSVDFVSEGARNLSGREVYGIEMELFQQGINFKVLTLLIKGEEDDVWLVSFNTVKDNWDQYQDLFQEIAASFKTRQD